MLIRVVDCSVVAARSFLRGTVPPYKWSPRGRAERGPRSNLSRRRDSRQYSGARVRRILPEVCGFPQLHGRPGFGGGTGFRCPRTEDTAARCQPGCAWQKRKDCGEERVVPGHRICEALQRCQHAQDGEYLFLVQL